MKQLLLFLALISLSLSKSLPHFIYDGIESFHDCSEETEKISFSIYGTLTEELDLKRMKVYDYLIEDMGNFKCSLQENENTKNKNRRHKIYCEISGLFERKGYILDEPKVSGFDFKNEYKETTWPNQPERKTFLIGKCGAKIELDDEPLLLLNSEIYSNPIDTVRKGIVDQVLKALPKRQSGNKATMISSMKSAKTQYSLSEAECAYLVYKWIGQNIVYDCYALNHGGIDFTEDGTYNKGKGVCAGFSSIFETMCDSLGLETEYVVGYSKGAGFNPGVIPKQSDHAWNAVKIGSSYYLVDSTWGSGACDGDIYTANFNDFFFCTNPEAFIRTHLPEEKQWQLISQTITLETFVKTLGLSATFYENGFTDISPDTATFTSTQTFKVTITFDPSNSIALLNNLYLLQGNTYMGQNNACMYSKGKNTAEITCITNYKGQYMLRIFGGPAGSESYPQIVEYIIQSTANSATPLGFPTLYGLFSSSDMNIVEPLYSPLSKGKSYNFQYTTTTYDNLYIYVENGNPIKLDKSGNVFSKKSVTIQGSSVAIVTLSGNYYQYILKYDAQ